MSTTTAPATFFAACPHTRSGYIGLKPSHPAHPSQFCFADELSLRNYERELKNLPFPDGTLPIALVTGINSTSRTAIIRALILHRHGIKHPLTLIAHSENSIRTYLHQAAERRDPYIWFLSDQHHSHALAVFAAGNPAVRIYCSSPLPGKPRTSASIARLSRVISLSA